MATPTKPPVAFKLETWAIDCLAEHELFPAGSSSVLAGSEEILAGSETVMAGTGEDTQGFVIVHDDEETRASVNRIVCKATLGKRDDAGIKPWFVSLEVRLILIDKAQDTIEHYTRAIEETFTAPPTVASLLAFTYLSIIDEEEEEKDERSDSRQRVKTYQFHAIDNDTEPGAVFAGSEDVLAGSEDVLAGAETST